MSPLQLLLFFAILLATASLLMTLLSHVCAHIKLSESRPTPGPRPGITVLKPLKGVDDVLLTNLESFAVQNYPSFELIFGTADLDDPALEVVRELARRHPDMVIRIVAGRNAIGLNPKVSNLASMATYASHEYLLISDSNVRVAPDYLTSLVAHLGDPRVGLVYNTIVGTGEASLGAMLENLHLNSFVVASMCSADILAGQACVVGKSMLFRRRDLERLGGWHSVRNLLAEDYVLGQRFEAAGYRVVLSNHHVHTVNVHWPISQFIGRHLRWSQLRRRVAPRTYLLEPLLNPIPCWVTVAVLASTAGESSSAAVVLAVLASAIKLGSEAVLARRLPGATARWNLVLVPLKDLIVFALWFVGLFRKTVLWRGNRLRIGAGSRLGAPCRPRKAVLHGVVDEVA